MIFDKLEMNGHIETQKMTKVTFFKKKTALLAILVPQIQSICIIHI